MSKQSNREPTASFFIAFFFELVKFVDQQSFMTSLAILIRD